MTVKYSKTFTMNCEHCVYSEISDWEQDEKTGKAKVIYWCKKHKKHCNDIPECIIEE